MNIFWDYESLTEEEKRRENKKLVERYPFLLPRDWNDEELKDYAYSWTLMDEIPRGWRIAFGELLFDELKKECERINYLNVLRLVQVKEKFGGLRIYTNGEPEGSKINDIIEKYSLLSENICIKCGKPDVNIVNDSWVSPYCLDCWIDIQQRYWEDRKEPEEILIDAKESYNELTHGNNEMADKLVWTRYSKEGKTEEVIDISETAKKIRENWSDYRNSAVLRMFEKGC